MLAELLVELGVAVRTCLDSRLTELVKFMRILSYLKMS